MELNGRVTRVMVDIGATHNFIVDYEATHLGLKLERDSSRMKAVNSEARPIVGLAKDVPVRVGTWSGKANFVAVPLDDFQVILGMEFLQAARVVPMPFLDALGDAADLFSPTKERDKEGGTNLCAALKLETETKDMGLFPPGVLKVLQEFEDVMPPELPKTLPPRRAVDHKIKLELGAKPPARLSYHMAPPELAEL
ncbi:uncharacterized protein [Elaeis guineensis]|uniref:uncharacterized protein n=1 Tax=Elaeis guineensis var. tenera TaxID=51953 RepID=UPI003C6DAE35